MWEARTPTASGSSCLGRAYGHGHYWSGFPFPSPGDLPDPGIETVSPALQADPLPFEQPGKCVCVCVCVYIYTYMIHFRVQLKSLLLLSHFSRV